MKVLKTSSCILVFSLLLTGLLPQRAHAARGRDYVMVTSGTLSVALLGILVVQAIRSEEKEETGEKSTSSPVLLPQEKASQAMENLGNLPKEGR